MARLNRGLGFFTAVAAAIGCGLDSAGFELQVSETEIFELLAIELDGFLLRIVVRRTTSFFAK